MKCYMIGYDLNRPGQNYPGLIAAIKRLSGGTWWHNLDSTWIIRSSLTADKIRNALIQHIDAKDELLVAHLSGEAAWYGIHPAGSQWLHNQLPNQSVLT